MSGSSITLTGARVVTWDSFYGANSPEQMEERAPWSVFENAEYSLDGDVLVISYTTFPADAPVSATIQFRRIR